MFEQLDYAISEERRKDLIRQAATYRQLRAQQATPKRPGTGRVVDLVHTVAIGMATIRDGIVSLFPHHRLNPRGSNR